jgi:Cu-Zn family superoxide dismutase
MAACAGILALASVGFATAQDATPATSRSSISAVGVLNTDGLQIGTVIGSESGGSLSLTITVSNLEPGEHGLHIHETGVCDVEGDTPFASAGGHFNPAGTMHGPGTATIVPLVGEGTPVPEAPASPVAEGTESHAGDLGNVTVQDNGRLSVAVTTDSVTLATGADNSLADADGSALVIHAGADDLHTDPSGESGDRIACAVLFAPMDGVAPAATPEG